MWIKSLTLQDFRAFQNPITFELSQNVTCISGHNGIGKSTILAVLSNCGEYKREDGEHINGSLFRGEFSDIIVGDKRYDSRGHKAEIQFNDVPRPEAGNTWVSSLGFRATFQGERYRLIPEKIKSVRETEAKIKWPTFYMGLSRLYPVGESKKTTNSELPTDTEEQLSLLHNSILSFRFGNNIHAKSIGIKEHSKRKTGFQSDEFSETANSSGQDNVGQIILTVLSFKKLKEDNPNNYHGGILLIDELDATLHPAAQRKLFDYLYSQSIELQLQIVFTTHSLSLLEYITLSRAKRGNTSTIKVSYLTRRNDGIHELENPSKEFFNNDLNDTYTGATPSINRVRVFTEDEIARWFLMQLFDFKNYNPSIELLDVKISWSHIINLMVSDVEVFKNYIAVLDPDINKSSNLSGLNGMIQGYPLSIDDNVSNILTLPGEPPEYPNVEKMLWNYVTTIPDTHAFFNDPIIVQNNWQQRLIVENGATSSEYSSFEDSLKYKNWFNDHKYFLDILMKYWVQDNDQAVTNFVNKFKGIYGKINKDINI